MLNFTLETIEQMKDTPQSKIRWLNLLQEEHKDILENDAAITKRIDALIENEIENEKKENDRVRIILEVWLKDPPQAGLVTILDRLIRQLSNINLSQDLQKLTGTKVPMRLSRPISEENKPDIEKLAETKTPTQQKVEFDLPEDMKRVYKESITLYETELKKQMEDLLASNLSPEIKLQQLDVLVAKRSAHSKEVVEIYREANQQLISEIKAQIIDTNSDFLRNISIEDLLNYRDDKPTESLSQIVSFFNKISRWVTLSILQNDINSRVLALESMIKLGVELFKAGDFNAAMAVNAGIKSSAVNKLKSTFDALSPAAKHNYAVLSDICSEASNFKNLKYAIDKFDGPKIPYLGLYTADLEFFRKGNKDREWSDNDVGVGIIAKFIQVQATINQSTVQNLSNNRSFINNLENSVNVDSKDYQYSSPLIEKAAYYLSTLNEPKDVKVVANVSSELLTQPAQMIPKPASGSVPKYLTPLQGNIQLINHHDDMLREYNLLHHKNLRHNLQRFNREKEAEIHDHYEAERFVDISENEWQAIIIKMNAMEDHPNFTDAKIDNLNDEQLLFIARYYKVSVKQEKGLIRYAECLGQDVITQGGKKVLNINQMGY